MRLKRENCFGFIIDIQERLVPVMHEKELLIDNSVKLVKGLHTLEVPMIFSRQYPKGIGETISEIKEAVNEPLTEYDKVTFSCMETEALADAVKRSERKQVVIAGIESHICVLQTVLDLLEQGYEVFVVADCVSSRKSTDKKFALKRAEQAGAILTTCESVLFELTGAAGTDVFKTISKIIK